MSKAAVEYMRRRVAAGLCRQCGAPREGASKQFCRIHAERHRELNRERYRRLHGPPRPKPTLEEQVERERSRREQKLQQNREKVASGLCGYVNCTSPKVPDRYYCEEHLERNRARNRERARRIRIDSCGAPGRSGRPRLSDEEREARKILHREKARERYRAKRRAEGHTLKQYRPYRSILKGQQLPAPIIDVAPEDYVETIERALLASLKAKYEPQP